MTLSFEEEISPADEAKILDEFVAVIRGGLEPDALDILVVRHRDKKHPTTGKVRPDYHITIVETELRTGKKITIYHHIKDHDIFYAWERMVNIRHKFSRPDDPARRRTMQISNRLGKDRKETLAAIDKAVREEVIAGRITDRPGVIRFFEKANFVIKRQGPDYLSIQDRAGDTIRLKGLFYEREFDSRRLAKSPTGTPANPDGGTPETLADVEKRFAGCFAYRVEKFQKLYRTGPNKIKAAALGGADDYDFVHHTDILFDPVHPPIRPEIERPSAVVFGEPPRFRRIGGIELGSSRRPGEVAGRTDADRSETFEGLNYEIQTVGIDQSLVEKIGRIGTRAHKARARTPGIFSVAAAAMGAKGFGFDRTSSGFAEAVAEFVEVVEAFDRAVKFARNPLGFLEQILIKFIKKKEQERLPVPPKISFP